MTEADLAEALKAEYDGSVLTSSILGGFHLDRADKNSADPYAVFTIRPLEPELFTESVKLPLYLVSVAVYTTAGASVTKDIGNQLDTTFGTEFELAEGRCIAVLPAAGVFEHEKSARGLEDVMVLTKAWRMLFQDVR